MTSAFLDRYKNKTVFLTGHTGFKGSWLALWLKELGANVVGYSLPAPTEPSLFELAKVGELVDHRIGDVRDFDLVRRTVQDLQPDYIFHLAAQPIVRKSYSEPVETLAVNVVGTACVLDAARCVKRPCSVVVVTSDKCYENQGWHFGYRETDPMGGHDPYSMSKGCAELVTSSWQRSFFSGDGPIRLGSGRAGNVIGGGDWAQDRIVTDCVASLRAGSPIGVRNPLATRPWQHVLEPLSGYLWLGAKLAGDDGKKYVGGWNFGPTARGIQPVRELVRVAIDQWGSGSWDDQSSADAPHEAKVLALCCDKAHRQLDWWPVWEFEDAVSQTIRWYRAWHDGEKDVRALSVRQIRLYNDDARKSNVAWAVSR
jgi:CDP-glucose 4,6-dehydratase